MTDQTKRVNRYYRNYRKAKEALDEFMNDNLDVIERLDELSDAYNTALNKLERVCREDKTGAGPVTASIRSKPVFNGEYLYDLLGDRPNVRDELVTIEYKVNKGVFEKLVRDGKLTPNQVKKGMPEVRETVALSGLPSNINLI